MAPLRGADFGRFAGAAAERYPYVRRWTIWNEPNQRRWLSTASPVQYVTRLLNPAYAAIHAASPSSRVAGGVTAPRGGAGGMSPVDFIRGMGRVGARLDAYAHHPYALCSDETPWSGGCDHCETITMATIGRLVTETTEGVQAPGAALVDGARLSVEPSRPDSRCRPALQASYIAAAAYKAWATPRVDLLIQYLYRDEPGLDRWQSGLVDVGRTPEARDRRRRGSSRRGQHGWARTTLWGAIRDGSGARAYRLQRLTPGGWRPRRRRPAHAQRTGRCAASCRPSAGVKLRLLASGQPGNDLVVR